MATFQVQLDESGITTQAREGAYAFAGDHVEVQLDDRTRVLDTQKGGVFSIAQGTAGNASVNNVTRSGPHRAGVIWRMASGGNTPFAPDAPHSVAISTRLRLSLWSFNAAFIKRTRGKTVELDPDMLTRLAHARIDDFSLVYGVTFDDSNASGGWVGWDSDGYRPNGDSALQVPYLRALIEKLHALGVRVTVGYNVRGSTVGQKLVAWLDKADDGQIRKHTEALNHWFEKKHKLDIDGIGFDFEFTELKERHRDKIAKLFQGTAAAVAHRNGIVSYANAPFQPDDGKNVLPWMLAQPYHTAAGEPNLIARPMCYEATFAYKDKVVIDSIACALRPVDKGGGGLHPSQLQMGIWAQAKEMGKQEMTRWCRDILRPNRVGLMLYTLPFSKKGVQETLASQKSFLDDCVEWDKALNGGEAGPGTAGQPLQVPNGYGGWPPKFNAA